MTDIQRLDYSKPPRGYGITKGSGWWPHTGGELLREDESYETADDATAAIWAHYKARNDPPGMWVSSGPRFEPDLAFWGVGVERAGEGDAVGAGEAELSLEAAREAAWAWYDRRLSLFALSDTTEGLMGTATASSAWPHCLTWSDDQVAEVERWLADSTAEMPEVLRG